MNSITDAIIQLTRAPESIREDNKAVFQVLIAQALSIVHEIQDKEISRSRATGIENAIEIRSPYNGTSDVNVTDWSKTIELCLNFLGAHGKIVLGEDHVEFYAPKDINSRTLREEKLTPHKNRLHAAFEKAGFTPSPTVQEPNRAAPYGEIVSLDNNTQTHDTETVKDQAHVYLEEVLGMRINC